jgi:hypothetical protein
MFDAMSTMAVRARVRNGRLTLDEPTDLPEGTELALVPLDEVDDDEPVDLSPSDLAELDRRIAESKKEQLITADVIFAELHARGSRPRISFATSSSDGSTSSRCSQT